MTTVGIFGGSFDPPHDGHVYVANTLMKLLRLEEVWWIVTNRNFLKQSCTCTLQEREKLVREKIKAHKRMKVVSVNSSYAYEVVQLLQNRNPHIRFVWIGGSDIMETLHLWHRWRELLQMLPIVLMERSGHVYGALRRPAAVSVQRILSYTHISDNTRFGWALHRARTNRLSSTLIREASEEVLPDKR